MAEKSIIRIGLTIIVRADDLMYASGREETYTIVPHDGTVLSVAKIVADLKARIRHNHCYITIDPPSAESAARPESGPGAPPGLTWP